MPAFCQRLWICCTNAFRFEKWSRACLNKVARGDSRHCFSDACPVQYSQVQVVSHSHWQLLFCLKTDVRFVCSATFHDNVWNDCILWRASILSLLQFPDFSTSADSGGRKTAEKFGFEIWTYQIHLVSRQVVLVVGLEPSPGHAVLCGNDKVAVGHDLWATCWRDSCKLGRRRHVCWSNQCYDGHFARIKRCGVDVILWRASLVVGSHVLSPHTC